MRRRKRKKTIGRTDLVDFPDLGLQNISVKIDTGAYTSSIHCHRIKETIKGGRPNLRVNFLDPSHELYEKKYKEFDDFEQSVVRNSFGQDEERYVIRTNILLFNKLFEIEMSLTNRSDMKHPILLGRKVLADNFVVDVSKKNLSYKFKNKKE